MSSFEKSVFVNCPFDPEYRQILLAILFSVKYLNYTPRIASESSDCADVRIGKIIRLIEECQIGIHDLSRIKAEKKGEVYRMNMPFELGMDFGARTLAHGKAEWGRKKILILGSKRYEYQKALSDLSGCDIKYHEDKAINAIKQIRNWFSSATAETPPPHAKIWGAFIEFNAYLADQLLAKGHAADDVNELPIPEIFRYYDLWSGSRKSGA